MEKRRKKYWVTSDWHLGHNNILKYDSRDFPNIAKHDWYIIGRFNELVDPEDDVYYLGDFALCKKSLAEAYMSALNGNLHFIKGNHDKTDTIKLYEKYGEFLGQQRKIEINGTVIVLNHFAMRTWDQAHRGALHFYGHSHDFMEREPWGRSQDVGVMTAKRIFRDYVPFNIEEYLIPTLSRREIKFVDGHKERI